MRIRRVLIVEDDRACRRVLWSHFSRMGWRVLEAQTVDEAVSSLSPPPDCVILDLCLPDGKGETVLRKIREDKTSTCVVAVTTGSCDPARLVQVSLLGPDLMIPKPINPDVLYRLCETGMGARLGPSLPGTEGG